MLSLMLLLGCEDEVKTYPSHTTREEGAPIIPVDTSIIDDSGTDTGDVVTVDSAKLVFETKNVTCATLLTHQLNFTRFHPGFTNSEDGSNNAVFFEEEDRFVLGDITLTEVMSDDQNPEELPQNCQFSVTLDAPKSTDLMPLDGEASGISWAFYYPSLFVKEQLDCTLELSDGTLEEYQPTCTLQNATASTQAPSEDDLDPELGSGDIYIWGTNIFPVYISSDAGGISASFEDMGFQNGWNLVQIDQNEITDVASLSTEDNALLPISVSLGDLTPKYSLSASGSFPSTEVTVFSQNFGIGARPLPWLNGSTSINPIKFFFFRGSTVEWWFHTWGMPSSDTFFSNMSYITSDAYSAFYDQWFKGPDISVHIPVAFSGQAGTYDGEVATSGDDVQSDATVISAICKDTSRVILAYYMPPRRASELYWYQHNGQVPGWRAISGTHGETNTWIELAQSTDSDYDYKNLSISTTCTLPSEWE